MALIPDVGSRRYMFEKTQTYLFSYGYDIPLNRCSRLLTATGLEWKILGNGTEVFHVLDDRRVLGNDVPTGKVLTVEETIDVGLNAESGVTQGRALFDVQDGYLICSWDGAVKFGTGCYSFLVSPDSDQWSGRVSAQITCRFETTNQKYKWLTEQLCAGFGRLTVVEGMLMSATFDIYGLG
jgi:hypothetical protein